MHVRPHRQQSRTDSRFPIPDHRPPTTDSRPAFTLIELIIVILVMLILMTLTVALIGDVLDSGRVSGAARQIQNYFAGARDRAIYSASRTEGQGVPPRVGVRFLSNPSLYDPVTGTHLGFNGMVFIQETAPVFGKLRVYENPPGSGQWFASQLDASGNPIPGNTSSVAALNLIYRGLVESRMEDPDGDGTFTETYYLHVVLQSDQNNKDYYIRFTSVGTANPPWLQQGTLSAPPPSGFLATDTWTMHLLPSPLPNEEPRLFPEGTIVEIQSSLVGNESLRAYSSAIDGSFDILFNAQGVVDGPISAAGLVHLVVADLEDIERDFRIINFNAAGNLSGFGSPFLDSDAGTAGVQPLLADGEPVTRQGDVRIVSLRARTGNAYASEINPVTNPTTNLYTDPFFYAETGAEAQ